MNNKIYDGIKFNNYRELINLFKEKYKELIAFEYRLTPTNHETIKKTYLDFYEDIINLAKFLLEIKSKRVALISPNRYEWGVAYFATEIAGMTIVPLDKSLPDNEIISLLERSSSDTIFYSSKYENAVEGCKNKICFDIEKENDFKISHLSKGPVSYGDVLSFGKNLNIDKLNSVELDPKSASIMLFTSGTTNISKAVMISQDAFLSTIHGLSQMISVPAGSVFLSFLPMHHTFESSTTFLYGLSFGFHIVFCDGLKYIMKNLVEFHVDGFVCVPLMLEVMYKKLIQELQKQKKLGMVKFMCKLFRHSSIERKRKVFKKVINSFGGNLKTIITGGAAMDVETLQGFNDLGFDIHQGYGLTETCGPVCGENSFNKRVGSVGFPLNNCELKIDEPDSNNIGEIVVKTPALFNEYYENEEATKEVLIDGWFHTGDLGYVDKDGFVFITGRKKDMIVLKNGKKIFPEELEKLVNDLPYVSESFVFGYEDNKKSDRNTDIILYAEIVLDKNNLSELKSRLPSAYENSNTEDISLYYNLVNDDIKNKINKQMPPYKYIRKIILTFEPLIKTTTLKIKRKEELKKLDLK